MFWRRAIKLLVLIAVGVAPAWAADHRASATLQINIIVKPTIEVPPSPKVEANSEVTFHLTPPPEVTVKREERTLPAATEQERNKPSSRLRTITYTAI